MADTKDNNVEFIHELDHSETLDQVTTMGTVKLTDGAIVYIPAPTADPQDPLNMPVWQKWIVLVIISCCEYNSSVLVESESNLCKQSLPLVCRLYRASEDSCKCFLHNLHQVGSSLTYTAASIFPDMSRLARITRISPI